MRPFFPALGTLALLGALLAGCGDDGGSASDDAASEDTAAAESSEDGGSGSDDDATASESSEDGGSASAEDTAGPESSEDGGSASAEAFCERAGELEERFASLDGSDRPTPELFQEVSDAFGELAEEAPDEISADVDALAAALATFAEVFRDVDPADPESLAVLEEEAARLEEESGRLEEAGANVEAYFRDECGIDLEEGTSGAGTDGAGADDGSAGEQPDEELDGEG